MLGIRKKSHNNQNTIYTVDKINNIQDSFINDKIPVHSSKISDNIKNEVAIMATDSEYKSIYLEDLAKVHIFMEQYSGKINNKLLGQLFEEQLFATYEHLKTVDGISIPFDKFFSDENFNNFTGILEGTAIRKDDTSKIAKTVKTLTEKYITFNSNNPLITTTKNSNILLEAGTHETQHFVTDDGTSNGFGFVKKQYGKYVYINEMCTEHNAIKIMENHLTGLLPETTYTRELIPSGKEITFSSKSNVYMEITQFYDALNIMSGNRLEKIYYDKSLNLDNLEPEFRKGLEDLSHIYSTLYEKHDTENQYMIEKRFDKLIDSFTSLSEKYVRKELGINKSTNLASDKDKSDKLKAFFDTFDSINFKKEGDKLTYGEQIKQRVLKSIFENENTVNDILSLTIKPAPATTSSATTSSSVSTPVTIPTATTKTIPEDSISFTLKINESKLKENCEALDINCSISQVNEFFNNLATDNGFNKADTESFYKEGASTEDIKSLVREFLKDKSYLNDCVENITVKNKDTSYTITDFSSAQEIRQKEMKNSLEKNKNMDKSKSTDTDIEL